MGEDMLVSPPALTPVRLGPVSIGVPRPGTIRHVRGVYGDLWQLIGDGRALVSLTVSSKRTPIGTADGVREHMDWEAQRMVANVKTLKLTSVSDDVAAAEVVTVSGSPHAAKVSTHSERAGISLHNVLVGTADAERMQVTHVAVRDTAAARLLAEAMADTIQLERGGE